MYFPSDTSDLLSQIWQIQGPRFSDFSGASFLPSIKMESPESSCVNLLKRSHDYDRVRLNGTLFNGLNAIATDPLVDPPMLSCFNCWEPDHLSRQCPRPRTTDFCKNCGRRHVDVQNCPRCRNAYVDYLNVYYVRPSSDNNMNNNKNGKKRLNQKRRKAPKVAIGKKATQAGAKESVKEDARAILNRLAVAKASPIEKDKSAESDAESVIFVAESKSTVVTVKQELDPGVSVNPLAETAVDSKDGESDVESIVFVAEMSPQKEKAKVKVKVKVKREPDAEKAPVKQERSDSSEKEDEAVIRNPLASVKSESRVNIDLPRVTSIVDQIERLTSLTSHLSPQFQEDMIRNIFAH